MNRYVAPLHEVGREDLAHVGGKAANLGEMIRAGFPVPPGFSVKAQSFEHFIDATAPPPLRPGTSAVTPSPARCGNRR